MKPIYLHVITPVLASGTRADSVELARLAAVIPSDVKFTHDYIGTGPRKIEGDFEDAQAVIATVELAKQAERDGADAIVINCTADTGLAACRECLSIPVVAPTLASMHLAAQLANKFSIVTFLERVNERFQNMAFRWGLAHKLASVRSVEIPVLGLGVDEGRLANRLFEQIRRCWTDDQAHAVILGCTDFEAVSGQIRALLSSAGIRLVLLEPYVVAVHEALGLARMRLSHSKLTYPLPDL